MKRHARSPERHRGGRQPAGSGRPSDFSDLGAHWRGAPTSGKGAVARVRAGAPPILGTLLDAMVHGLRATGRVHLERLPRMADFALWATACETALWPAGTFACAYAANRRAAIESIIEADPIANCVRAMMVDRTIWTGSASDLFLLCSEGAREGISSGGGWAKNPRALAGRLRRAQTFLRSLGIEITFSREGRTGTRMIKVSTNSENCVSTVSIVGACRSNGGHGDLHGVSRVLE